MKVSSLNNKPSKRYLKVYYCHRPRAKHKYKIHPLIRLSGIYLSAKDFKIGDTIEVTVEQGKIVITKMVSSK